MLSSLLGASTPGKRCLLQGGGEHEGGWSGSGLGTQARAPTTRGGEFLLGEGSELPSLLCCLQSLVISEGRHERGTRMQLNPKTKGNPRKKGSIPSQRKHPAFGTSAAPWACTARRKLEFPTDSAGILHSAGSHRTATSQIQGVIPDSSEPPVPSSAHGEPGEEPGAAQVGWGGSTPGGRVHQEGEAAALEDSALQDRDFFT